MTAVDVIWLIGKTLREPMIITCPECQTRFKTSAKAIGPNGRTVRCASCSTTWFVSAEESDLALDRLSLEDIEASEFEVVEQERQTKSVLKKGLSEQSKRKESLGSGRIVDEGAIAASTWTGEPVADTTLRGAHSDMRELAERRRSRRRLWNVMLIWLVPLILLGAIAAAGYYYRQDVVNRIPKSASLYKALGIDVSAPGLTLSPPTTRYVQIDGKPVLIVEGAVKNISNEALSLPLVALSLHNSSGQKLAEWNVELGDAPLRAGASSDYLSQYPAPPLDAVELRSRFSHELQGISTPVDIFTPEPN